MLLFSSIAVMRPAVPGLDCSSLAATVARLGCPVAPRSTSCPTSQITPCATAYRGLTREWMQFLLFKLIAEYI